MGSSDGLTRVFWPSDAPRDYKPGVLIGWRNSDSDVLVISILHDVELKTVESALRAGNLFRNSPYPIHRILERCGPSPLQVLGLINGKTEAFATNQSYLRLFHNASSRYPTMKRVPEHSQTLQIILFDRPRPSRMQYLSLSPISLALGDKSDKKGMALFPVLDGADQGEEKRREKISMLVEKLKQHTVIRHPHPLKELSLPTVIDQINSSFEIDSLMQKNLILIGARQRRVLSVSERVVESATNLWEHVLQVLWRLASDHVFPILLQFFVYVLMAHRCLGEVLLVILDWRISPSRAAIKDVSATAQQVDIRLQQFCYWPIQYITLRKSKRTWQSITDHHPEYIRFYNSLWLVANDIIIGIALGSYIIENASFVVEQLDNILTLWTIEGLESTINWLTHTPGGLKLNRELARFLGELFLWVIDYWAGCISAIRPLLPGIINFIGFSSFAGATMPISLFSDLASLLTIHIHAFYIASARIWGWQLAILFSLFQLFRGKKRNVLRNRIDNCDYDLDQLLAGTVLFTLVFFLLPTVFVFYLLFALSRMIIIFVKATLDTLLACLNHFPLFALMLRFKDYRRLPGGIEFDLRRVLVLPSTDISKPVATTSVIYIKSIPLPFSLMLESYFQLAGRIRKHYLSPRVMGCLASGRFVPPIHRKNLYSLQYSMLPAKRVGISELWHQLTTEQKSKPQVEDDFLIDEGHPGGFTKRGWIGVQPPLPRRGSSFK